METGGINFENALALWTVYDSPKDFPGLFVARLFVIEGGESYATNKFVTAATLEGVRAQLPPGLYRFNRAPADEPQIVETWI